jgi:hypothetical protein
MSPTSVVAAAEPTASTPQGARHRHLQLWWWPLLDMSAAPPRGPTIDVFNFGDGRSRTYWQHLLGGPPSTSPTSVVTDVGPAASTPRGPTIDVSNFDGGRCRTYRHHPLGGLPSTSPTSVVAAVGHVAAPPRGPTIDVFNFGGGHCRTCRQHPLGVLPSMSPTSGPPALASLGGPPSTRFLALMVGALKPPAPAPPRGLPSTAE